MTEKLTTYGRVVIGPQAEIFAEAVALAEAQREKGASRQFTWALSGGSTPQDWFRWCAKTGALSPEMIASAHFTVSDERPVPLSSPDSNFGSAARLLLDPVGVPAAQRHPWAAEYAPALAAAGYREMLRVLIGPGRGYDVCMLGLGPDTHTASLFPGSPLLQDDGGELFTAVLATDRGWRLTITPTGLRACGLIVVMATGAGKAAALARVFGGEFDPVACPAQILEGCAERVVWLLDGAAGAGVPS